MYGFELLIDSELAAVNYLIEKFEKKSHDVVSGALSYRITNNDITYHLGKSHTVDGKRKVLTSELGNAESAKVIDVKLKRFNRESLKRLQSNKKLLESIKGRYADYSPAKVHVDLPAAYKDLPAECYADERFEELVDWAEGKYNKNRKKFPRPSNITITGNQVRSKGEVIIYNMLVYYNVPFRYENRLTLVDYNGEKVNRYPDFTILTQSGRFIYWEHVGKLEDQDYYENFCEKIKLYHNNDICLGDNLIVTSDRNGGTMNTQMADGIIRHLILPLVR